VRGFTLIELLIVVAIMALLLGLALPLMVFGVRGQRPASPSPSIEQAPPSVQAVGALRQPVTESSQFHVELKAFQEVDGWKVRTRYHARVEATYVIRNQDGHELELAFPFPAGMTEARSVSLSRSAGDSWVEPAGVSYDLAAIRWTGPVEPGEALTLRIAYESEGRDAFVYDVAGSGRSGTVNAEIVLVGVERPLVPPQSLPPTEVTPGRLVWSFHHLVTNERIRVELPPGPSPLGRLVQLCQLAALAVLLFGAGFWYLSELDRPGRLDTFRWGHFLLLAGNYSLFFAVFALAGDVAHGLPLGAGASLPLLYVHVSRFVDRRFALSRVMPLAVLTLGIVVVAVYLPSLRPVLALGAGALGAAFVTLSYRGFSQKRIAFAEEKRRERERRQLVAQIDGALVDDPAIDEALAAAPESPEKARAQAAREHLAARQAEAQGLRAEPSPRAVERIKLQLAQALEAARAALPPLVRLAAEAREQGITRRRHCIDCGMPAGQRHCGSCGAAQPEEKTCAGCGERSRLLLKAVALASPVHCGGCGARLD
jgi:prepilin-type N-terminal cleavage/methylation domain-containing protein